MANPYEPPANHSQTPSPYYHASSVAYVSLCVSGGLAWIALAHLLRGIDATLARYVPPATFIAFVCVATFFGRRDLQAKVLAGTFLIWFPYPLHAGLVSCSVPNGLLEQREAAYGHLPPMQWYAVTLSGVAIGVVVTIAYLCFVRRHIDARLGWQFVVSSWGAQVLHYFAVSFLT